jgi:sugar phosphate isomerase/epimerase
VANHRCSYRNGGSIRPQIPRNNLRIKVNVLLRSAESYERLARRFIYRLLLQTPIFDCLERIRSAGFTIIEVCSFPAHLNYHDREAVKRASTLINQLELEPYSFHAPFADHIDITSLDAQVRDASVREIVRAAEAAAELGVRHFVIHPGTREGRLSRRATAASHGNAAQSLNQLARRCREIGVRLVLENMLPHLFFGRTRDVMWILGALDTTDVGICLDTGHAHLSGDLRTVAHKLSGHLRMVHASDNRGSPGRPSTAGRGRHRLVPVSRSTWKAPL